MQLRGQPPSGLEYGNARSLRDVSQPHTNWIVGDTPAIPLTSLRWLNQSASDPAGTCSQLCVKWFQHHPDDPVAWGLNKPSSEGRTLSILASTGCFHYTFSGQEGDFDLWLEEPGDFVIWGPNLSHQWRVIEPSSVLSVRWMG